MFLFDIAQKEKELSALEDKVNDPNFWNDQENSNKILQEIKLLKDKVTNYNNIKSEFEDLETLVEIVEEENDESSVFEVLKSYRQLSKEISKLEMENLLAGPHDKNNAIITIHPGAGGTESQDWAQMLYRMYTMWAEKNGFKLEEVDYLDGEVAGIKSVTFRIIGKYAYGYLKSESGVHRLVRISPFDSGGRRHTSFASVEVIPEIDDTVNIVINPNDLKIDTYRASGAGGQHINKTESAIRITHIPTNIIVSCQTQRSQIQNKDYAMKMLISKLVELKERENKDKIEDLKGVQREIAWGSQIRSYVFCPYTMVKDHRTNHEVSNVEAVMDGEINDFIDKYLRANMQ